jgi:hypothetical protein
LGYFLHIHWIGSIKGLAKDRIPTKIDETGFLSCS